MSNTLKTGMDVGSEESNINDCADGEELKPLLELGQVFIERRVLKHFSLRVIDDFLREYAACEPGHLSDIGLANEWALFYGGPTYAFLRDEARTEAYVVTEADRSRTMLMMSDERNTPRPGRRQSTLSG